MPTASVIALTAVPCRPVWVKCSTAAATSASRRSSAVWRVRAGAVSSARRASRRRTWGAVFSAMVLTGYLVIAYFSNS